MAKPKDADDDFDFPDDDDTKGLVADKDGLEAEAEEEEVDEELPTVEEEEEAPAKVAKKAKDPAEEEEPEIDIERELLAAKVAEQDRVIASLIEAGNKKNTTDTTDQLKGLLVQARERLAAAIEADDTPEQVKLMEHMQDIKMHMRVMEEQAKAAPARQQEQTLTPSAQRWVTKNRWFQDPAHADKAGYVATLHTVLTNRGFVPNSDEYFKQLDKILVKKYPDIYTQKARAQVAPTTQVGREAKAQPKGKIVLTKEDYNVMEKMGMDPRNKAHRQRMAQTKAALSGGRSMTHG